jgi:poly-gamma-glutamate capsule biosynthesis protein CapA/YwtB (metallophosphatase superfamily)
MQHKNSVTLAAFGDVMLDRDVGQHFLTMPSDFSMPDIREALSGCDLIFANLENPVSNNGKAHATQKPRVTFCAKPESLDILDALGVKIVSLGNNHMLDYGETALKDTLKHLDEYDIAHAGAGSDYSEANTPILLNINSVSLSFISHTFVYSASTLAATTRSPGVADPNIQGILATISKLASQGHQVVVSLHWGIEYGFYPLPYQRAYAHKMIDAGAVLILGHGPHYPQGVEEYGKGLIFYSLGNFIFDEPYFFAKRTFFPRVTITNQGIAKHFDIIPIELPNHIPQVMTGARGKKMVRLIESLYPIYARKDRHFWRHINDVYFSDIVWRCRTMKSFKFLFLPPLEFYKQVGLKNVLKRISPRNFMKIFSGG